MGRDKAALLIGSTPLWQRQLATLRAAQPDEILISGRSDGPYAQSGVEIVTDETPGFGPLAGIITGMRRARYDWLLVLAIDLPAMTSAFLRGLIEQAARERRGVVPETASTLEPLAAIYPRSCLPIAVECLASDDRSMRQFCRLAHERGLTSASSITGEDEVLFRNVNSPADL